MIIAAVTCVRDEADIIEEWVAHHLALGIQRILIFDNGSQDQTRAKLTALAVQNPDITVLAWSPATAPAQQAAFEAGLAQMRGEAVDWCAFLDADEFIVNAATDGPAAEESFAAFLTRHEAHHAIGLNWALFGSAGHVTRPWGLMQEAFLRRAEDGFSVNRHIKSIVRPRAARSVHHAHALALDHPYYNADGEELVWRTSEHGNPVLPFAYTETFPSLTGWRINHYFCRWRDRWDEKVRLSRLLGGVTRSELDWQHHDRNEVRDATALRWTANVRARMAEMGVKPYVPEPKAL